MVGESSKPLMESTVTSAMPEALTTGGSTIPSSDQASKLLAPILSSVIRYLVARKAVTSCSSFDTVVLASVKAGFSMGSVSNAEVTLGLGYRTLGPPVLGWVAWQRQRQRLWFKINFLLSLTWVMGFKMSLW